MWRFLQTFQRWHPSFKAPDTGRLPVEALTIYVRVAVLVRWSVTGRAVCSWTRPTCSGTGSTPTLRPRRSQSAPCPAASERSNASSRSVAGDGGRSGRYSLLTGVGWSGMGLMGSQLVQVCQVDLRGLRCSTMTRLSLMHHTPRASWPKGVEQPHLIPGLSLSRSLLR